MSVKFANCAKERSEMFYRYVYFPVGIKFTFSV